MSGKVELELLRRLEAMTKERDEALADIETLKTHVETLREAWRSASDEVNRLRAERDALAGEASSIEQNVGALLDLYHDRMLEAENQSKLAWKRHAEKDRAYGSALAERDEAREALGTAWLAGGVSLAEGIRRKTARLEQLAIKKVAP